MKKLWSIYTVLALILLVVPAMASEDQGSFHALTNIGAKVTGMSDEQLAAVEGAQGFCPVCWNAGALGQVIAALQAEVLGALPQVDTAWVNRVSELYTAWATGLIELDSSAATTLTAARGTTQAQADTASVTPSTLALTQMNRSVGQSESPNLIQSNTRFIQTFRP